MTSLRMAPTHQSIGTYLDGFTIDTVSEFTMLSDDELRKQATINMRGIEDALRTFVYGLATTGSIMLPSSKLHTAYSEITKSELKQLGSLTLFPRENFAEREALFPFLESRWESVMREIETNAQLHASILGFLLREERNAFVEPIPGYSTEHYHKIGLPKLAVPERLKLAMMSILGNQLTPNSRISHGELSEWIDEVLTVHYLNYLAACQVAPYYAPSFTRSAVDAHLLSESAFARSFGDPHKSETLLIRLSKCIATEILSTVPHRRDLLKRTVEWTKSRRGEEVVQGYKLLANALAGPDRDRYVREAERILDGPASKNATFVVFELTNRIAGWIRGIPVDDLKRRREPSVRWLFDARRSNSDSIFREHVERLIRK